MQVWLASLVAALAAAQLPDGVMAGRVTDAATGGPLAGATVVLRDLDRVTVTDADGRYELRGVPVGPQHVLVRRIGYAYRAFHALVPPEGTLSINVALEAVPVTLSPIEVRGRLETRGLDDAVSSDRRLFADQSLSLAAARNHPLLAETDVLQALNGGEVVTQPESPTGLHIRGGAADQVTYLIDGIPIFNPYHAAGTFSAWNPDALSRLDVATTLPSSALPDALSGVVSARTRVPDTRFGVQAGVSTTQARVTADGRLRGHGPSYLVSVRSTFPGLLFHRDEPTYLEGEAADGLGRVGLALLGGSLQLLAYGSDNEISANALAPPPSSDSSGSIGRANLFDWNGQSFGAEWTRTFGFGTLQLRAWRAVAEVRSTWQPGDTVQQLSSDRRDTGALLQFEWTRGGNTTAAGLRGRWSETEYAVRSDAAEPIVSLGGDTPLAAAFVDHTRRIGAARLELSLAGTAAANDLFLSPGLGVRWNPAPALSLGIGFTRRHQFEQSLRNPESVVSAIFPADLYVGAGHGVPVARSTQAVATADLAPAPGIRLGLRGYVRDFAGLALVAPRSPDPYATTSVAVGSGSARGLSLEVAASGTRYSLLATYGIQRVRFRDDAIEYAPEHDVRHSVEAGVSVFPFAATLVRLGVSNRFGRRATAVEGPFEWEACNLADQGCEFAGTPRTRPGDLGAIALPSYFRLDLGVRQHWHLRIGDRDCMVAVFGTITNLTGHRNIWTVTGDPAAEEGGQVEMRPRSPLVVGIDWRF